MLSEAYPEDIILLCCDGAAWHMNRFEGSGLYILDEPESALSPQRLMSLLVVINE